MEAALETTKVGQSGELMYILTMLEKRIALSRKRKNTLSMVDKWGFCITSELMIRMTSEPDARCSYVCDDT